MFPSDRSRLFARLSEAVGRRCAIDLRGLAVFRMAVGFVVVADLLARSRDLVAFYTDSGVLLRRALASDYSGIYSIHTLSGDAWFQALLFVVAGMFALMLIVGYRTRTATVVSWLLLLSLRARNPMIFNSGDDLLGLLLFWGIFLPLGERWSVDARRIDRDRSTVVSLASLGILVQVLLVYVTNAVHKSRSEEWMSGEALAMVYQADQYTVRLGDFFASYPALLEWLTAAWLWLLVLSPLLLLLTGARRAMLTTMFVGVHLGIALTMNIATFPLVSIAAMLVYYPPSVWEWLTRLLTRTGVLDRTRSLRDRLPTLGSAVTLPTDATARLDGVGAALDRGRAAVSLVVPYLFLVLVLTSAAADVGYASVPEPGEEVLEVTETDQDWAMFAPDPVRTTRWYAAPGRLEDGRMVDTLHESDVIFDPGAGTNDSFRRPDDVEGTYPSARFHKYLVNVQFADNDNHRSYLANYLCDRWNRRHDTTVETVSIWALSERTDPYNGTVISERKSRLIEYDCSGPLVQE
ncbi:HTTM domain-containing protein [Halovenus sp. WSH3]|uniref:HTTM domain-containing protein n=1 Tax=Halovenus carboxidivorans TaxID=2692199 RepID=A0A6B0TCY1_9EURY|nr:HTTM domain-containing protein [Halovenus carboxidivorans]MXR52770.1 HTTM domain-containing protein [Halovenus carboxidivorans]